MQQKYDVFICHASEDKAAFVNDLVAALQQRGLLVWYDDFEIQLGDDFRRKMEQGLANSRFGVVILSSSFDKFWTQQELSALLTQESLDGSKRILPVVLELAWPQVVAGAPLLATRHHADAAEGAEAVARKIESAVRNLPADSPTSPWSSRASGTCPAPSNSWSRHSNPLSATWASSIPPLGSRATIWLVYTSLRAN